MPNAGSQAQKLRGALEGAAIQQGPYGEWTWSSLADHLVSLGWHVDDCLDVAREVFRQGREAAAAEIEALRDQLIAGDDSEGTYLTAAVLTKAIEIAKEADQ